MVSTRCKLIVKSVLDDMGIAYNTVDLGEVELKKALTDEERITIQKKLSQYGLELMLDERAILIQRIKNLVVEMVHYTDELPLEKNSAYIASKLNHNYNYLAGLFSEATGTTLEHYIIQHKIERVKELLIYDELNLSEIAHKLHYSSVSHLSHQFKKVTGLTPTFFKKMKEKKRSNLEDI